MIALLSIQLSENYELNSKCKNAVMKGLELLQTRQEDGKRAIVIAQNNLDDVLKLQESQDLLNVMNEIETLTSRMKKLVTPNDESTIQRNIERSFIGKFFDTYARRHGLVFDEESFSKLYSELEGYIYEKADYKYLAPLFNLRLDIEEVTIDDMIVRYMKDEEFEELFGISREWREGRFDFYNSRVDFLAETTSKKYDTSVQEEKIRNFLNAIGIFKMESVQIRDVTCILPTFYPVELRSRSGVNIRRGIPHGYPILVESEIEKFKKFYSMYRNVQKPKNLESAIKRFNYGLQSLNFEDMVIDFMIALESLFGDEGEITHKISIRIALLFGQNEFDTECIRNFVKKMYGLRSKIVHGDDVGKALQKINITENRAKDRLSSIARNSIVAYLYLIESGMNGKDIIKNLDTSISSQSLRDEIIKKAKIVWKA